MPAHQFQLRFRPHMKTHEITHEFTSSIDSKSTVLGEVNSALFFKAPENALWNLDIHVVGKTEPTSLRAVEGDMKLADILLDRDVWAITICSWHVHGMLACNARIVELNTPGGSVKATFNARGGGKTNFGETSEYFRQPRMQKDTRINALNELVAKRRMQATNPPDNLAQPNEQLRSQSTKEGNTTMSQINHSVPVQTLTFVFGQRIDTMGKTELFTSAQAVAAQIAGLEKSNDAVGSVAIAQEIAGLKKDLAEIRRLLDTQFAKADEAVTGVAAAE